MQRLLDLLKRPSCHFFRKANRSGQRRNPSTRAARLNIRTASYKKAREFYTRLKEEYPLHELAILAELGIADSFYSDKEYVEAELAYRDFTTFYPTNENVPYAFYQMGMCHYVQIGAVDRDQTETIRAKREFERLVARFPQSKFSILAEKMIRECKMKLAEHEFYVGNFYFKQKKYNAALKRFEAIARDYAGVGMDLKVESYIAETKARLAEEEKSQKLKEEKAKANAKRQRNFQTINNSFFNSVIQPF